GDDGTAPDRAAGLSGVRRETHRADAPGLRPRRWPRRFSPRDGTHDAAGARLCGAAEDVARPAALSPATVGHERELARVRPHGRRAVVWLRLREPARGL